MNRRAGELLEHSDEPPSPSSSATARSAGRVDGILRDGGARDGRRRHEHGHRPGPHARAAAPAIFGDAFNIEVMHQALARATHLIITLPHSANRNPLIAAAKLINPEIKVFVRAATSPSATSWSRSAPTRAVYEEAEAAVALARLVLSDRGADDDTVRHETTRIRQTFAAPA